jgi:hypothetical protein
MQIAYTGFSDVRDISFIIKKDKKWYIENSK